MGTIIIMERTTFTTLAITLGGALLLLGVLIGYSISQRREQKRFEHILDRILPTPADYQVDYDELAEPYTEPNYEEWKQSLVAYAQSLTEPLKRPETN